MPRPLLELDATQGLRDLSGFNSEFSSPKPIAKLS